MRKLLIAGVIAGAAFATSTFAAGLAPLDSDSEPDRVDWFDMSAKFGPVPKPADGTTAGAVAKTLTNEYWRLLGDGYTKGGGRLGLKVDLQAAQSEGDQLGQLSIAETMITQGYKVLLVSPQTDANLQPAIEQAAAAGIPVVNVNDAVIPSAEHRRQRPARQRRARRALVHQEPSRRRQGGGDRGHGRGLRRGPAHRWLQVDDRWRGGKVQVVASIPGNWDRQLSYDAAATLLQQHPDLIGFYCNNDGMALGVVEAVKAAGLLGKVLVIGTDGISDAYASIRAGELTGTVDSFPVLTGEVAIEAALRILGGQKLPRVVATPQALITKDNLGRYYGDGVDLRAVLTEDAKANYERRAGPFKAGPRMLRRGFSWRDRLSVSASAISREASPA